MILSDFIDAMVELLPEHNSLKNKDNQLRQVLNKTVGAWFDDRDVRDFYDQLFINTATGKWLDLHGKDYGVYRKLDESDEDYRVRIIQEKQDNLTPGYLESLYNLTIYAYVDGFEASKNTLTSDNPYVSNKYMAVDDGSGVFSILDKKFILDNVISRIVFGDLNYIINGWDVDILENYLQLYELSDIHGYFGQSTVKKVKLTLPLAENCYHLFYMDSSLTDVDLKLPRATNCEDMLGACTGLVNARLDLPALESFNGLLGTSSELVNVYINAPLMSSYTNIFYACECLETVIVNIPDDLVTSFKSYVLGLNLDTLDTFIVNGEEVDLS